MFIKKGREREKAAWHLSVDSSSSVSALRVVSSAYLKLLIFLSAILIPACASSSPAFLLMPQGRAGLVFFSFLRLFGRKNMRGKERQPTQQPSFLLPCTQMPNIAQGSCMTLSRRWILIGLSPASLLPITGLGMVMWPLPGQWEVSKCLLRFFIFFFWTEFFCPCSE